MINSIYAVGFMAAGGVVVYHICTLLAIVHIQCTYALSFMGKVGRMGQFLDGVRSCRTWQHV